MQKLHYHPFFWMHEMLCRYFAFHSQKIHLEKLDVKLWYSHFPCGRQRSRAVYPRSQGKPVEVLGIRPPNLKSLLSPWARSGRQFSVNHSEVDPIPPAGLIPVFICAALSELLMALLTFFLNFLMYQSLSQNGLRKKFSVWEACKTYEKPSRGSSVSWVEGCIYHLHLPS